MDKKPGENVSGGGLVESVECETRGENSFHFGKYFDEVMRLDRGRVRYKMLPRVTSNALSCSIIHCSFIHVSVDREQKIHYWNRRTKTC